MRAAVSVQASPEIAEPACGEWGCVNERETDAHSAPLCGGGGWAWNPTVPTQADTGRSPPEPTFTMFQPAQNLSRFDSLSKG
jgi:hypothetical protein